MSRRDPRGDDYRPGPPGKTSAPIPKRPLEVAPPTPPEVVLPEAVDMFSALKRRAHRDGPPVVFDGGFQP